MLAEGIVELGLFLTAGKHPNRNLTARYLLAQEADETRARKFQAAVTDRHGEHVKVLPAHWKMPFPCVRTVVEGIAFEFLLFHFHGKFACATRNAHQMVIPFRALSVTYGISIPRDCEAVPLPFRPNPGLPPGWPGLDEEFSQS